MFRIRKNRKLDTVTRALITEGEIIVDELKFIIAYSNIIAKMY